MCLYSIHVDLETTLGEQDKRVTAVLTNWQWLGSLCDDQIFKWQEALYWTLGLFNEFMTL